MPELQTEAGPGAAGHPFTAAAALAQQPPALTARMVSLGVCAMAVIAIVYACLARLDVVVTAQGKVIPSGRSKTVQPLEAGVVQRIAVRDGQRVKAGDVLLELDPTNTAADHDRLQHELWESATDAARLQALAGQGTMAAPADTPAQIVARQRALLASRQAEQQARLASLDADQARRQADRDAIAAALERMRQSLPLVQKKHAMREELARTGHIAEAGLIETRLELINLEKEIAVQGNRLKEADAGIRGVASQRSQAVAEFQARAGGELAEAMRKHGSLQQELVKAQQRRDLQVLRAPIDGVVQQLAVSTVGGVVTAAQPLLTIVPENAPLEVEAQVMNRDIGYVRAGQRVINKIETFDFTRFGYIEGEVQWVGTDAVQDARLGAVYPVRIKLHAAQTPHATAGARGVVAPGMAVVADVRTDSRRLIDYFLAPMLRYRQEALRER